MNDIDKVKEIEENLKVGLLDLIILKLVSEGDIYGYDIKLKINELSNGHITINEGSLYGPLYRLEKKHYISSYKTLVGKKRYRIYYHIEDEGKDYLIFSTNVFKDVYGAALNILEK